MLTGDRSGADHAIRQLNWATYMVDVDGKNRYMQDENWLTDGYGDYVRHYLRSMAAMPELAPATGITCFQQVQLCNIFSTRGS
jgi:hypothetical protein